MGRVAIRTVFTELMGVPHPIVLAPMGGSAGGALAAAVSNGGGLGLVGAGREAREWVTRELEIVRGRTTAPWGVGFQSWSSKPSDVQAALEYRPHAVMLSFGDPGPFADAVREAGARLVVQVSDVDEARRALEVGADLLVAQGAEAGGHSGRRSTLSFVPVVVDLAGPVPVLAAGGIADGRGVAAALALGAVGALVGTRFQASSEALVDGEVVRAILEHSGEDTERTRLLDIARGAAWPARYPARAIRNAFLEEWRGREAELERDEGAKARYREKAQAGDLSVLPVWASEAIDLIRSVASAEDLVRLLAGEAEEALRRAAGRLGPEPPESRPG